MTSSYRFSRALVVRLLGIGLVAIGALVILAVVLGAVLSAPVPIVAGVLPLVVLLVVLLAIAVTLLARVAVVIFDETGYRVRFVRGAGVREERWTAVEDVAAGDVAGTRCVVLRLRDGRTSVVPVGVLAAREDALVADLREHLNRGHGYRPLRPRGG